MYLTRIQELESPPAVTVGDQTITYGQLRDAVGAFATQVAGARRVAVWAESTLQAIVAAVAIVESGIELLPLNPKLGSSELEHILSDSLPDLIVGAPKVGPLAGTPHVTVDLSARGPLPEPPPDPESVAMVIYTSGTTGLPKGVLVPRRAVATNLDALAEAWAWTADDRLAHALPLFHIHGLVLGVFGPLRRGGHVHHVGRFSPETLASAVAMGATMVFGVPTMYQRIAEAAEADPTIAAAFRRSRLLVSGSAGLPSRTFERIQRTTGQSIVERYGLTETLINTAVRADGTRRAGEVGRPLADVQVRVVLEDGSDAAADGETIGEVVVQGPNVFLGYLNRPQATAEVMRDGWFWTGDLATLAPDGYLRIVGRKSTDLIKTGGYKVGAGEVEGALLEHPSVSDVAVASRPDDDLGEKIVAWIVLEPDAERPSPQALADHVATLLAPHKRPRQVYFINELPRNAMGKVVKQKLAEP